VRKSRLAPEAGGRVGRGAPKGLALLLRPAHGAREDGVEVADGQQLRARPCAAREPRGGAAQTASGQARGCARPGRGRAGGSVELGGGNRGCGHGGFGQPVRCSVELGSGG
jgi:hypothetical protein